MCARLGGGRRGYCCEREETEALCRALIDRAFPDLTADATADASREAQRLLREQLTLLDIERRGAEGSFKELATLHA